MITALHLLTSGSGAGGGAASFVTGSMSPSPYKLIVGTITNTVASGTAGTPTLSGNTLTWDQINTRADSSATRRITMFRCLSQFVPPSGAVTIDFAGVTQSGCEWSFNEFLGIDQGGVNGTFAVVQNAGNDAVAATNTGLIVTMTNPFSNANNATFGGIRNNTTRETPGSGFTEMGVANTAGNVWIETEFKNSNDTTVDWTWASVSNSSVAMAIEIKAAQMAQIGVNNLRPAIFKPGIAR